jgi:hypothetical protein
MMESTWTAGGSLGTARRPITQVVQEHKQQVYAFGGFSMVAVYRSNRRIRWFYLDN